MPTSPGTSPPDVQPDVQPDAQPDGRPDGRPDVRPSAVGARPPERRPQAERSLASRSRILDAAVECLLEQGYARTNTLSIQARAGVSRGRLLHQFPSKDELLVAAAHHVFTAALADPFDVDDLVAQAPAPGERIDAVIDLLWRTFHVPHFWAATELWVAARTQPALAEVVRPAERRLGRAIWARMDALFGRDLVVRPGYPMLRPVLFTSMRGVVLSYSFDPRDPATEPMLGNWRQLARGVLLADV